LQPIIIDPLPNGQFRLVAGGRRLRAAQLAGWTEIAAVRRDQLSDPELREIELEENEARLDYSEQERSKSFSASREAVEKAGEFRSAKPTKDHNSGRKKQRGRPADVASQREAAKAMGISHQQLSRAERHVAIAEEFPFMQNEQWSQGDCLAVE